MIEAGLRGALGYVCKSDWRQSLSVETLILGNEKNFAGRFHGRSNLTDPFSGMRKCAGYDQTSETGMSLNLASQ